MRLFLAFIASLLLLAGSSDAFAQSPASVLLVSFDGFRHDYIDKHDLKNFKAFREGGASAKSLMPCYPSLTYANHYSIVTGMRPATNGLVDNNFYDSVSNVTYSQSNRAAVYDPQYYGGTALWTLAKRSGMKTASYFWVADEVKDKSIAPDVVYRYDGKVPFRTRVDSVLKWLNKNDKERPRLVTLYFSEPDHTGHDTGPDSPETHAALLMMDSVLGYLTDGLKKVKAPVNTILVSDHGMTELTREEKTFVYLDELYNVKSTKVKTVVSSALAHLYIDEKHTLDSMYALLKSKEDRFKVYKRKELPRHLQYDHYRIGDLVLISEPTYYIRHSGRRPDTNESKHFGVHGYDPTIVTDMHGIFLARGPQIKKGQRLDVVRNIDIYPLVCRILGLQVPKIDGDPKALEKVYNGK
ncbi:MAG TPA: ectonucleotide pyrophosphatase/phosphodiesterase [Cyclobacteriaceae bacterium]|nr:ectonucleotide pyrophosphatase/phosphodiesterase [Cyclobacteriaceae bacterium]